MCPRQRRGTGRVEGVNAREPSPPTVSRRLCVRAVGVPSSEGRTSGCCFRRESFTWSAHPVLSKPVMLREVVPTDGSPGRSDLSLGEQLRQRAAMGSEKECAELAAFQAGEPP